MDTTYYNHSHTNSMLFKVIYLVPCEINRNILRNIWYETLIKIFEQDSPYFLIKRWKLVYIFENGRPHKTNTTRCQLDTPDSRNNCEHFLFAPSFKRNRRHAQFQAGFCLLRHARGKLVPVLERYAMKTYGRVKVKLHSIQISPSKGRHWSAPYSGDRASSRRLRGPQNRSARDGEKTDLCPCQRLSQVIHSLECDLLAQLSLLKLSLAHTHIRTHTRVLYAAGNWVN